MTGLTSSVHSCTVDEPPQFPPRVFLRLGVWILGKIIAAILVGTGVGFGAAWAGALLFKPKSVAGNAGLGLGAQAIGVGAAVAIMKVA